MSATVGSVLLEQATRLDSAKIIDDGLANWKAEQIAKSWDAFDGGIQRIVAEVIRRWPIGEDHGDIAAILSLIDQSRLL